MEKYNNNKGKNLNLKTEYAINKRIFILMTIPMFFFFMNCQETQKQEDRTPAKSEKEEVTQSISLEAETLTNNDLLFAWVDKLNVRNEPSTKGKVVAVVYSETPLKFTGKKSKRSENIVLRGVSYKEPWFKIITPDKIEGWVFGGAVRRKGESKGNKMIDDENFEFPHFGSFKLEEWEKLSTKDESGGDAEIITTTYKKGNQVLEISIVDVGDYGYGRIYRLLGADNKLLKERELNFSADAEMRELRETVKDFTTQPTRLFIRTQQIKKHHSQLNALPKMVNGVWTESTM